MKANKGFSLIELMIVIAIIGIVAGIAAPSFIKYRQNTNLKEATRALEADIALIKQRAVAENSNYRITFNQGDNNYIIQKKDNTGTYNDIETKTPASFGSGIIISGDNLPAFAFGNTYVVAYTRGTMDAGTVTLINGRGSKGKITTNIVGRMYVTFDLK